MTKPAGLPIGLELAPLPREQVGPFLLLGVDKTADKEEIEACWAQRLIWARKGIVRTPLEDINWSREMLQDVDKRVRADTASINLDTTEGSLKRLVKQFGPQDAAPACKPLDAEKALADYTPDVTVPDPAPVQAEIALPPAQIEVPMVRRLLEQLVETPIDPWSVSLPE
jgi:hypothetical protein